MDKYRIEYKSKTIFRLAENAVDAIDRLTNQYGWNYKLNQVDADTRGKEWAEVFCDREGGINYNMRIFAAVEKGKKIKDGWHTVAGYMVYVENGRILRGLNARGDKTLYPYRWNKQYGSRVNDSGLTVDAFRAGIRRGTIEML
jgi:hypothetical protein